SGFKSLQAYKSGFFNDAIKLQVGHTAGVIADLYQYPGHHDEIDMEFLGTIPGKPYTLQTNIYISGSGDGQVLTSRELKFHLWFDPTEDFHNYSILWTPSHIITVSRFLLAGILGMENLLGVKDSVDDYICSEYSSVDCGGVLSSSTCIVSVLASVLERTVGRNNRVINDKCTLSGNKYRVFNVDRVPEMSIERYLQRILKHTNASPSVFVVAYAYIDRFCAFHPEFRITSLNVHRLLITVVMVASKFLEDLNYRNCYYGAVGGLEVEEINEMEMEFLFLMKFKLQVT
ncbi:hypothetical protein KI387_003848, partial [Taxus chinensis]